MSDKSILNDERIKKLDDFVGFLLDQYAEGKVTRFDAILDIGHLMVALDQRNLTEIDLYPDNKREAYLAK